jgi:aryl sulfotransferase
MNDQAREPSAMRAVFDNPRRWQGFEFRDDDIVIATGGKCGTTWMQMQVALLLFRTPQLPAPLAVLSPWLEMNTRPLDEVRADLAAQTHRRFVKSHTPLDELPWDDRVTYVHVSRDPRDVALSWDNHVANVDVGRFIEARAASVGLDDLAELGISGPPEPLEDPLERFWQWMEGDGGNEPSGLADLVAISHSFWIARDRPNVHLFHYADLQADLAGQMTRLADVLGVEPPTPELVTAASFEAMKDRADELVPNSDTALWKDNSQFFNKGGSGRWRALVDESDLARYHTALAALVDDADFVAWLEHGSRPSNGSPETRTDQA